MSELITKAVEVARDLHEGKAFGKDSNMFEQIHGLVDVLDAYTTLSGTEKEELIAAAWLSKAIEPSKVADTKKPLEFSEIQSLFGNNVANTVQELCTEEAKEKAAEKKYKADQLANGVAQENVKSEPKDAIWLKKSIDAQGLSQTAREILMAEKKSNFVNDANTAKTKKGYAWHIEYYLTRMLMVTALKETNLHLYKDLRDLAVKGISAHLLDAQAKEGKNPIDVCQDIVRNKSNMTMTPEMEKLMATRMNLIHSAYELTHKEVISQQKNTVHTTVGTRTTSLEQLAQMSKAAPVKSHQKPLDFTNKSVFTYVYGKGVTR